MNLDLNILISSLATAHNIDYNDLENFLKNKRTNVTNNNFSSKCLHKMISGKNKGMECGKKTVQNGYCSKHQGTFLKLQSGGFKPVKKSSTGTGKITKTEQNIQEWLGTAVPSTETILTKCEHGLIHEGTELLFNDEFYVIGRLNKNKNKNKINAISHYEVELCEKNGWRYLKDCVELLSESTSE